MSTEPTPTNQEAKPLDLEAAERIIEVACTELSRLCHARWEGGRAWETAWKWSIPAKPGIDTDLRIGDAIGLAKDLLALVRSQSEEVATLRALDFDIQVVWRMMEKKGPHYPTCWTTTDPDNMNASCDCGYVAIHRLVLKAPATPAEEPAGAPTEGPAV